MNETLPSAAARPADHPPVASGRIGVLLVNLGTPDATDYWSMRRYLKEFLSDRRVIETNRFVWWLVLNLVILTIRPGRKGRDYDKIWNKERDESPLRTITRAQAEKLAASLSAVDARITVDWAMRYGNPSIASRLDALQKAGCDRILIVPLYPQYCAATTATVADKAFDTLRTMRWQPAVRIAPPWHDDPVYIEALASSLEAELKKLTFKPEMILASFHGIPKEYLTKGDPYYCQCHKTARLLGARLGLGREPLHAHLPVALRRRRMAAALHRHDREGARRARREKSRDDHAGICRRLPRNAGRNCRRECGDLSPCGRKELRGDSLP